jgi:predicted PurR-regulated permease PerM
VFATAIRPLVLWLNRRGVPLWLGVLLVYALLSGLTLATLAAVVPLLIEQVSALVAELPGYVERMREWINSSSIPLVRRFANQLPTTLPPVTATAQGDEEISAVAQTIGYIRAGGWSVFGAIAISIISFFWIIDREQIVRAGLLLVPIERRDDARDLYETLELKVGAFIRGQVLLCLSIFVLSLITFGAIGLPNWILLSVLAGVLEAVPYIGPIVTAALAISLTLAQAPDKIIWVIGACVVIQQLENAVLVPRIMDREVGVNAVVTLLAIAAFGTLLGIGGAIMAIPLAVIIQVLIERLLLRASDGDAVEIEGRDQVARLRYQAHDLATDLRERVRAHGDTDEELLEEQLEAIVGDVDELLQAIRTPALEGRPATTQP